MNSNGACDRRAWIQAGGYSRSVSYTTLKVKGPAHDRSFTAAAIVDGEVLGTGVGRSKKDAEQAAAKEALAVLPG